jgi:hypothetical protein
MFVAMRLAFVGAALAAVALPIGLQASAAGASPHVQTDPQAGSPAGVIYQIPLDSARNSAAPVLSVGSHDGVHGVTGGVGGGVTGGSGDPSSIHSENGFGSSSKVPGLSRSALGIGAGTAAAHPGGSTFPTFLLIGLVSIAAVAAGVLATGARAKRRRREGPDDGPSDGPA